jgi:hypothetical protein
LKSFLIVFLLKKHSYCYENIDDEEKERKVREKVFHIRVILLQMHPIFREIQEYENGLMSQMFGPMTNGHPR